MTNNAKVTVENVNVPGHTVRLDAVKYKAMKRVLLKVLPKKPPGLSAKEIRDRMLPLLPQDMWPHGEKSGWWFKMVQLDLEAKGILKRDERSKPLRWWKSA